MILGAIIGDVVGRPYEFDNIKTKEFELVTERSRFSDDSIMTLAIANALRNWKKGSPIDEDEFKHVVIKSMRHFGKLYPHAGYGDGFKRWLKTTPPNLITATATVQQCGFHQLHGTSMTLIKLRNTQQ